MDRRRRRQSGCRHEHDLRHPTVVSMPNGTFDIDGNTTGDTVVISSPLTLNVASVDDEDNDRIDGTTRVEGILGQLNVQLTNPTHAYEFRREFWN